MSISRTNDEVATVFDEIARLLDAQGENPFKIMAYRNAVRTLHELNEPVAEIAARGDLRKIPGFGEAIAGKTQEILATGTCELYERLKAEDAARESSVEEDEGPAAVGVTEDADIPSPW